MEQEIIQDLKDQYKKIFESEIDMRDQEHILQDEANSKIKQAQDAQLVENEPQISKFTAENQPEVEDPSQKVNISNSVSPNDEQDMEVDIDQIHVDIPENSKDGEEKENPNDSAEITEKRIESVEPQKQDVEQKDSDREQHEERKSQPEISDEPEDMNVDLKPEDMNVDAKSEEYESKEEDKDSIDYWAKEVILEILDFVIERKELVNTLEQQKRKWIMWGKKKAKEALEKASKRKAWNIQKKIVSAKTSLEEVFMEHENYIKGAQKSALSFLEEEEEVKECKRWSLDDNLIEEVMVPLNLAIFQWLHIPIINQAKIINRAFIHL